MNRIRRSPVYFMALTIFIDFAGFGIVLPLLPFWAERLGAAAVGSFASPPTTQGETLGFAQDVAGLGRVIGPLAAGSLFAIGGSGAPFFFGSVLVVLAALIALPTLSSKHEVTLTHSTPDVQTISTAFSF